MLFPREISLLTICMYIEEIFLYSRYLHNFSSFPICFWGFRNFNLILQNVIAVIRRKMLYTYLPDRAILTDFRDFNKTMGSM